MAERQRDWLGDEIPTDEEWCLRKLVDACREFRDWSKNRNAATLPGLIETLADLTDQYDAAKVDPGYTPIETQSLAGYYKDQASQYQKMYEEERKRVFQLQEMLEGEYRTQQYRWIEPEKAP